MGVKDELSSITDAIEAGGPPAASPKPGMKTSRTAPGALFQFSEQSQRMERELDELKKLAGGPRMLKRSSLRSSPFQTRALSPQKVQDLADNLRENELATPIVVREIEPDIFEVIAGHHRDAAFGVLGRDEVPGIVVKMTDEQAERAVFFDNFYPPEVSDFEKFLGLRQIQLRHGYTHDQLAQKSGISRSHVSTLMAFEKLPPAAAVVLEAHPQVLGATQAAKLAQLDAKHAARVSEGLQLVADGKLLQTQLIDWIVPKATPKRVEPTVVKSGKSTYAKLSRRDNKVTIDFTNVGDAEDLEKAIATLLKEHATAGR